jgi:hypothetical protein
LDVWQRLDRFHARHRAPHCILLDKDLGMLAFDFGL